MAINPRRKIMAKVRRRKVTADDGSSVQFVVVVDDDQLVAGDDRTGVITTDVNGSETFVPMSAQAVRNTAAWFDAAS
jgi:hypothetical protein